VVLCVADIYEMLALSEYVAESLRVVKHGLVVGSVDKSYLAGADLEKAVEILIDGDD